MIKGTNVGLRTNEKINYVSWELSFQNRDVFIILWLKIKKTRFYDKETITALTYKIHQICLSYPLSFFANQIINPFLNSRISANHKKVQGLSANGKILIKGVVSLF